MLSLSLRVFFFDSFFVICTFVALFFVSFSLFCLSVLHVFVSFCFVLLCLLFCLYTFLSLFSSLFCAHHITTLHSYIGAGGTRTPLHLDKLATIAINLYTCGTGVKRWWLIDAAQAENLDRKIKEHEG